MYFRFSRTQTYRSFYFLRRLFAKHQTLSSQCWIFRFKVFLVFFVVIVISILLKTTFSQISVHSQLLVKLLQRSDKEKTTFKAIEKCRYGLRKTVSKHLNSNSPILLRPLGKNLFKQPPTSSEIASFWTPLPSEFPLACRGGHACFLELHNTK